MWSLGSTWPPENKLDITLSIFKLEASDYVW